MGAPKHLSASDRAWVSTFRGLVDRYLEETHARYPQEASRLGLSEFDACLGQNDATTHQTQIALANDTLSRVEALPEAAFTGDDWLDRRGFLSMLRTRQMTDGLFQRWRNNPQVHCDAATDAIFSLLIRYARNLPKALPAIESRLNQLPRFLEQGAECLKSPVPLWSRLAVKSCEGSRHFLEEITPVLLEYTDQPRRLRRRIRAASEAFARYAAAVEDAIPGRENGFSVGRSAFEMLMRERLGLDWSLPEALANGRRLLAQQEFLLEQEARRHGKKTARELLEDLKSEWLPRRDLLSDYRRVTGQLRQALPALDLVTLPKRESLQVLPVPEFLRNHFPTAAYDAPGPFDRRQEGIFWVNDLSQKTADPERRFKEIRQHFGLELTAVHEAYPGHHLQFVLQNRHPSKVRRLFTHSIYYEGWTMWCEHLAVEHGLVEAPGAKLIQLHDALWRAHRILIDCGLHGGDLSFEQACLQLVNGVGFTGGRAEGDVNWYTYSPTVPMSYLLGRCEVEQLYRYFQQHWSIREFNDWILSHGAIPWSWIRHAYFASGGACSKNLKASPGPGTAAK